jgi:tetratricopeptide (TPR) repeat protein
MQRGPLDACGVRHIAPADQAGAALVQELEPELAILLWRVLRLAQSSRIVLHPEHERAACAALEAGLLCGALPEMVRAPAAVIAGEAASGQPNAELVAKACWCLVEWALGVGAARTAVAFAEAAGLSAEQSGRHALATGRFMRRNGLPREGEAWLRRARRLARASRDWDCLVLSTSSLAMHVWEQGNYPVSKRLLERARRTARAHKLRTLEGEVMHNLLVLAIDMKRGKEAQEYAEGTFERYLPDHPKLPALAYDVAYLWLTQGHAGRALAMFQALLPHFTDVAPRVQILAAICRCAGLTGNAELVMESEAHTRALTSSYQREMPMLPAALIDIGIALGTVGDMDRARVALRRAGEIAGKAGNSECLMRAEQALADLEFNHGTRDLETGHRRAAQPAQDAFATRFVQALADVVPAG